MRQVGIYTFDDVIDKIFTFASVEWNEVKLSHGGKRVKLTCIIPGHKETNPSLSIDRETGTFRCYGCGNRGTVYALGKLVGIDVGNSKSDEVDPDTDEFAMMSSHLEGIEKSVPSDSVKPPPHLHKLPPKLKWRGMPSSFLSEVGAMLWYDTRSYIERVWFPCQQDGEIVGWFARIRSEEDKEKFRVAASLAKSSYLKLKRSKRYEISHLKDLEKEYRRAKERYDVIKGMKYRNDDKQKTWKILFPLDYVAKTFKKSKTIVLVEGQVDALWLIFHGIPALAILGTNNWSKTKETILQSEGYERVILAMDGDKPGLKAQRRLYKTLKHSFKKVVRFTCPDDKDPAEMTPKELRKLKELL